MIAGKRTEAEYRKIPLDSSSSLKEFSLDRRKYKKRYIDGEKVEEEDSKASITGRVTETLLFEKDQFDERFYLSSTASTPSGNMGLFVEALYKHSQSEGSFEEACKLAYKDSGYKWSFEKVLEKFVGSDAEIYYNEIRNVRSKGLTVVTLDEVNNAERIVEELKTNEFTAPILNLEDSERYTILVQYQVEEFEVDGLPLKAMMDYIVIDHKDKTIQVYDLKCVWSVENFYEEYYLYRRAYIQAYIYKEACWTILNNLELEGYTVKNPIFIVSDSINYFLPLLYTLDSRDITDAYVGFEHKGKYYPGVQNIIKDLIWSKENNQWRISRENYLNNGQVPIKS